MSKPLKIDAIIPNLFDQEHQWKYQLLSNWRNIFGTMSDKLYLERINNDVLILAVYDACWMQELYSLSPLLLDTINKTFDKPYIKQLRFKRAGIRPKKEQKNTGYEKHVTYKPYTLTYQEERALASVKDTQLAKALRDFLTRCYNEQQLYKNNRSKP
jgi:hypothetical protein